MSSARKKAAPPPRRRRDPETARAEILDAAERLLAEQPPDAIGLKEVAEAAGVSHALISHYFGTYAELVEAVLARRLRIQREAALARLRAPGDLIDSGELLAMLFAMLEDPIYRRLSLWALASERPSARLSFPLREQGMRIITDALADRIQRDRPDLAGESLHARVEMVVVTANAAAYGYMVGRVAWQEALGHAPSATFDRQVREALDEMVRGYLFGQ